MEKSRMDQKTHRLLVREIANMETTHHPNIIRLFEVFIFMKILIMIEIDLFFKLNYKRELKIIQDVPMKI